MRRLCLAFICLLAAVSLAGPAFAHAHLLVSDPAANATVAAPSEVVLTYSEALELTFTTVEVRDAAGKQVDKADLQFVGADHRKIGIGLAPLTPGTYTVIWHATSVDTHKTEGKFDFTVTR